ncbi:cytochrome P450 [Leifsonia sp. NPDC080035]|uniref:Cytochrome P450 n=1 Tax=Leifsonia sp. NPDC080035 TaxID=3143936 RepID=A0AAU7GAN6_9MICO
MRDETLAFAREGYLFGTRRFQRAGADVAVTRLAGVPLTLLRGADAARFFYEGGRFHRSGAMPASVQHLLQDEGSVQSLEGQAHRTRKAVFLDLLTGGAESGLVERFGRELWMAARASAGGEVRLIDLFSVALLRAVCAWSGLPDAVAADLERSHALQRMIAGAGTIGPLNWEARLRRRRAERLLADTVARQRHAPFAPDGSALAVLAAHTEPDPLSLEVAAVELLNILRPVVAVAWFLTFAALALHRRPAWQDRLANGTDEEVRWFSNEVRRFYPFFPFVAGRASRELEWGGRTFPEGSRVALDLYATDHHPALWDEPGRFDPERFDGLVVEPNTLIPQGGGRYAEDHRCPGEPVTLELMDEGVRRLTRRIAYTVPEQDLRVSLRRFPALPRSGLIVGRLSFRD